MFERSCADGAGPDESGELRGFAGDVVWAYLVARQERLPEAVAELRVCEQLLICCLHRPPLHVNLSSLAWRPGRVF